MSQESPRDQESYFQNEPILASITGNNNVNHNKPVACVPRLRDTATEQSNICSTRSMVKLGKWALRENMQEYCRNQRQCQHECQSMAESITETAAGKTYLPGG